MLLSLNVNPHPRHAPRMAGKRKRTDAKDAKDTGVQQHDHLAPSTSPHESVVDDTKQSLLFASVPTAVLSLHNLHRAGHVLRLSALQLATLRAADASVVRQWIQSKQNLLRPGCRLVLARPIVLWLKVARILRSQELTQPSNTTMMMKEPDISDEEEFAWHINAKWAVNVRVEADGDDLEVGHSLTTAWRAEGGRSTPCPLACTDEDALLWGVDWSAVIHDVRANELVNLTALEPGQLRVLYQFPDIGTETGEVNVEAWLVLDAQALYTACKLPVASPLNAAQLFFWPTRDRAC